MMFWQCKFMYKILNIVLYPVLYFTISFVHILIIAPLHAYKKGTLQISRLY